MRAGRDGWRSRVEAGLGVGAAGEEQRIDRRDGAVAEENEEGEEGAADDVGVCRGGQSGAAGGRGRWDT